jgi:hypothetical protein
MTLQADRGGDQDRSDVSESSFPVLRFDLDTWDIWLQPPFLLECFVVFENLSLMCIGGISRITNL